MYDVIIILGDDMKKVAFTILLVFSFAFVTGCNKVETKVEENNIDITTNTEEEVLKEQTVDGLTFLDASLKYVGGTSKFQAKVTNTTDKKIELDHVNVHLKSGDGTEMIVLPGFIGDSIEPGESRTINVSYQGDLSGATKIEYEIIK